MNETPCQLAMKINKAFGHLPIEEQIIIKRVYEKTWTIVTLHVEGLANPTKASIERLKALHYAIGQSGRTLGLKYFSN